MKFKKQKKIPRFVTRKYGDAGVVEVSPGRWMATGPRFGISSNNLGYYADKEEAKAIVKESYRDALPVGRFYYVYPGENPDKSKLYLPNGEFSKIDADNYDWLSSYQLGMTSHGYVRATIYGESEYLHRLVCPPPDANVLLVVDHINRNKLDNRRENLRVVTAKENSHNCSPNKNNSLGFRGVTRVWNGRYKAEIKAHGVKVYIGSFDNPEEAAVAYQEYADVLHGEEYMTVERASREGLLPVYTERPRRNKHLSDCFRAKRNEVRAA